MFQICLEQHIGKDKDKDVNWKETQWWSRHDRHTYIFKIIESQMD